MQKKRLILILSASSILLLIPIVAMQFTDEVNWALGDFVVAGVLLMGTGYLCELVLRRTKDTVHRIAICGMLLILLLLVWAELAVGLFGTPFAGH